MDASPLPDSITNLLVTLGDSQRQRVLRAFLDARTWELPATAIAARCAPLSRPAVSHHLAMMRRTKVLTARRDGKHIYYTINRNYIETALHSFLAFLDTCCTPADECTPADRHAAVAAGTEAAR
ncbi:MAG: helix-turn-helix transcriptional regulator [Chloroflexi bacterium]|nr:helix-turn-helix transcriptional regulator [Chloroflexota bacterium]